MKSEFTDRLEKEPENDYEKISTNSNSNVYSIEFDFLTKVAIIKGYECNEQLYVSRLDFNDILSIKIIDPKIIERIIKKEPLDPESCWAI